MGSTEVERARIVVVSSNDAATIRDCLDGLAALGLHGTDVVVVDLASDDGSADVAIHHPLPHTVATVPDGDGDRILDVGAVDAGLRPIVVLPADRRPRPGWLEAALAGLADGWVVLGADSGVRHLAVDRVRLQHLSLGGATQADEVIARVRGAGGEVVVAAGMRTDPATAASGPMPADAPLPPMPRPPADLPRHQGLLTVVLCTRGRPDLVGRCLASLTELEDPCHEIVVVDNNDTPGIARGGLPGTARVVHEPRRGLDIARNRGLAESRGDVVAFIDDDCEADPSWLDHLRVVFADPLVGAATGRVRPASLRTPPQRWFEAQFSFDRGTVGRRFTPWDRREWYPLWTGGIGTGCNMAFRRTVVAAIGGFDDVLDMGSTIGGGGDLDVFARLLDRGAVIEYAPGALVWHHHRATPDAARLQFRGYGRSVGALLTKAALERPGLRVAAVRFYLDRLRLGARSVRRATAGSHDVPVQLLLVDMAGQLSGVGAYLRARRRAGRGIR